MSGRHWLCLVDGAGIASLTWKRFFLVTASLSKFLVWSRSDLLRNQSTMAPDVGEKRKHGGDASAASSSKKSKPKSKSRDADSSFSGESSSKGKSKQQGTATLKVSRDDPYRMGPLFVNTADFVPAEDAAFTLYTNPSLSTKKKRRKSDAAGGPTLEDNLILAGETDSIEYVGGNWSAHATVGTDESLRTEARGYSGE